MGRLAHGRNMELDARVKLALVGCPIGLAMTSIWWTQGKRRARARRISGAGTKGKQAAACMGRMVQKGGSQRGEFGGEIAIERAIESSTARVKSCAEQWPQIPGGNKAQTASGRPK